MSRSDLGGKISAPARATAESKARPMEKEERCDLCGGPMLDLHCKLICRQCGFKRDCSDP